MSIQNWKDRVFQGSKFDNAFYADDVFECKKNGEAYANAFFAVDEDTIISIGCDPISPREFMDRNQDKSFILDTSKQPKKFRGKILYYAKPVEALGDIINGSLKLPFMFVLGDHLRYENKERVAGFHGGAPRAIKIEENIWGNEGYTVTIFNIDSPQPTIQMAPKQMKIANPNEVNKYFGDDMSRLVLRGFGSDSSAGSFVHNAVSLYHSNNVVVYVALHMIDRNIDIVYYK